ncbi:uncharacterized protein RHOBADRAFT_51918 [Rhodotorula graminis WP1]|uniref:Uncharacterized protein n=1 Tax=Rhodotorula graminis (strain WP1) TaxID=578459 RepID=A0A194S881_RHOGW|nr:uncharacterized protein RHOBADRAFT_51918 [Rhodotorula graminis WP1]KPV76938.1 hypothetical protein RHOBADRAFT_51918 [Rhodotorula graminis WP1]
MARSVSPPPKQADSRPRSTASGSSKPSQQPRAVSAAASSDKGRPPRQGVPLAPEVFTSFQQTHKHVKGASVPPRAREGSASNRSAPPPSPVKARGVSEILRVQETEGLGRLYMCKTEDGKKVQRSRTDLKRLVPALLEAFDAAHSPAPTRTRSREPATAAALDDDDSSDDELEIVVKPKRKPKPTAPSPPKKKLDKGKGRAVQQGDDDDDDDDVEMRDASSSSGGEGNKEQEKEAATSSDDPDDPDDEDVSAPSGSSSSSDDAARSADSDVDDYGPRRSTRASSRRTTKAAKKPIQQAGRRSTRRTARTAKRYFGNDGSGDASSSDGDSGGDESASSRSEAPRATRTSARITRASATLTGSRSGTGTRSPEEDEQEDGKGESSDELGIFARPRKTAQQAVEDSEDDDDVFVEDGGAEAGEAEEDRPQDDHRQICGKCGHEPASVLLQRIENRRKNRKGGRRRKRDEFDDDTDDQEARAEKLGSWVECGVCCQSYHFLCLPPLQKRDLVDKLNADHLAKHAPPPPPAPPVAKVAADPAAETPDGDNLAVVADAAHTGSATPAALRAPTAKPLAAPVRAKREFNTSRVLTIAKCPMCKKAGGRKCFVCALSGRRVTAREKEEFSAQLDGVDEVEKALKPGVMFRCTKCKRVAHYGCLENDEPDWSFAQHVRSYNEYDVCHQCYNWNAPLNVILAWAEADPLPEGDGDDVEPDDEAVAPVAGETRIDDKTQKVVVLPSIKDLWANVKYLVKWQDMSYRRLEWVPHAFIAANYPGKLGGFLARGSLVKFETAKDDDPEDADPTDDQEDAGEAPLPDPNALERIPEAWRTVDRVLDVWYKHPKTGVDTPFASFKKRLPEDPGESIKLVSQCYFKWGDLAYSSSTVEEPPQSDEAGYDDYVSAYEAFLVASRPQMSVPSLSVKQMDQLDAPRDPARFVEIDEQPDYIEGHRLHDFQLAGVNYLRNRWWLRKGCILADEMGLGKTCQVITFLTYLNKKEGARPFLILVPNSLIGNWMREFSQWAPSMRVVPYNGDANSRKIVEDYELFDSNGALKTQVVLATYEAFANNARVFRQVDRWDCLVVDEGQRLKSGPESLLYGAIASLRVAQRIILTGTPLNNNIHELFNLLRFINPDEYRDGRVEKLVKEYEELTPERVENIRGMLRPYLLRRTKETIEVVVPVTMTVLQRGLYRNILERNAAAIRTIVQTSGSSREQATKGKKKTGTFSNILMELRKSLCHPYLVDADMEPLVASARDAHRNLTEASAKLVLLARMLPRLKAAGHRVLIFSQFKITLNIIERFLSGLDVDFLRLDGDTPQLDRQRDVDKFNAPGSKYFAYLLSTRAGGVGLNITSADAVIIYDQDFNPQQDLQAISRAHRIGQTKPVRVFKLVVKGTCEEKILVAGSKKRGLEHLIIQRIDAQDESDDVEGMLQFGAKAVFDDQAAEASAIRYSDADIDELIAKTADPAAKESDSAATFAHAQMWTRQKDGDDDPAALPVAVDDAVPTAVEGVQQDLHDFWSKVVDQQQQAEKANKAAQAAAAGRGKRKRAEVNYKLDVAYHNKGKTRGTSPHSTATDLDLSSGDDYRHRDELDSDDDWTGRLDADDKLVQVGDDGKQKPSGPSKKKQKTKHADDARASTRKQKVVSLLQQAIQIGCVEAQGVLERAQHVETVKEQTRLVLDAIKHLDKHALALKQKALVDNAAVANSAHVVKPVSVRKAPAPTSTSKDKPVARGTTASSSASGKGARHAPTTVANPVKPASSATAASSLDSHASRPSLAASTSNVKSSSSTGMVRVDSGGGASDTSHKSSSGTPKLKQTALSFGKPVASPSLSSSSAAHAAAATAATSAPQAAAAALPSTVPLKRPSPPSADLPNPKKEPSGSPAPHKKKREVIVISDSE